jgi:hypothetical protein
VHVDDEESEEIEPMHIEGSEENGNEYLSDDEVEPSDEAEDWGIATGR